MPRGLTCTALIQRSSVRPVGTKCLCHRSFPFAGMSIATEGMIASGAPKSASKFHASGSRKGGACTIVSGSLLQ